jgi:hypothetical protein
LLSGILGRTNKRERFELSEMNNDNNHDAYKALPCTVPEGIEASVLL